MFFNCFGEIAKTKTTSATFINNLQGFEKMAVNVFQLVEQYLVKVVIGIVILLIGFGIGVLAKKITYRIFKEIKLNNIFSSLGITTNLEKGVSNIISYVIYLITIIFFLDHFNIRSIVLYLIFGAVLMLIILTFLVGLKDVIPNFVAWLIIQQKDKVKEGRHVNVKEISGIVEKIGYLETEIKTDRGDILYVPNSLFVKTKFWIHKRE